MKDRQTGNQNVSFKSNDKCTSQFPFKKNSARLNETDLNFGNVISGLFQLFRNKITHNGHVLDKSKWKKETV